MAVNLTGLRCLVQIVESRLNVSAAAQAMHLSQPSVSRQLRQLEDALGFQVFARHGRSLVGITPAGTQAIEVARRVVRDVEGLHGFAAHARGEAGAELLIAAPQGYVLHLLPPLLSQLRERYPDIGVRIRTLGEGERVRAAEHDRCDMVMLSSAGDERPDGIAIPLFHWKRVAIVSREHPLAAHKGPLSLETLATWPLVTYEASRQPDSSFCRVMAAAGLSPKFACSAQDGDTLKAYAHAGLGVGLVAELALGPGDRERFVALEVEDRLPDCTAWAGLPRGRVLRQPTIELLRLLAPQLDPEWLRRASQGMPPAGWPEPPTLRFG
jgi:DNA-binding transcriptional LysR family regulator